MQELIDLIAQYQHKCRETNGCYSGMDEGKLSGLRTALRIWKRHEKQKATEAYHERHGTHGTGKHTPEPGQA